MRKLTFILLLSVSLLAADITDDLVSIGVPAHFSEFRDSVIVVGISGSLAEGDSLLKHYGGIFFTVIDSISTGWDVCGINVQLQEATLMFRRCDMFLLVEEMATIDNDEVIAEWVLNRTRVVRTSGD